MRIGSVVTIGNKVSQTNAESEITTWTYDAANQLITENIDTELTTFLYDAVGNRLIKETFDEITTSTYDAANQLQLRRVRFNAPQDTTLNIIEEQIDKPLCSFSVSR